MCLNSGDIVKGRYEIIDLLGRGGFGTTYKAYDNHQSANSPFVVVIKQISISQTIDNEAVRESYYIKRLEREANTLRDLKHFCIPRFFESFTEENYYYIVQEYIKGHDLSHEIRPGEPIEEAAVVSILQEMLIILQFVHQQNIIHRDIKPANIVRRHSDNKLVLIDFGAVKEVATEHTDASGRTLTAIIYAPGYTPPEQLAGMPRFNSDIYALGIIAMRGVTGFAIGTIIDPERIPKRDGQCNFIWEEYAPQISPEYKRIISRMIECNWKNRYQDVENVLQDIKSVSSPSIIKKKIEDTQDKTLVPTSGLMNKKMLGIGLTGAILGASFTAMLPFISFPWEKYEETKIDFENVCNWIHKKQPELQEEFNEVTSLHDDIYKESIWTVFLWKCHFKKGDNIRNVGINLDDYCAEKHEDSDYKYEAYFKYSRDPNSWYCTRVGTKQESKFLPE